MEQVYRCQMTLDNTYDYQQSEYLSHAFVLNYSQTFCYSFCLKNAQGVCNHYQCVQTRSHTFFDTVSDFDYDSQAYLCFSLSIDVLRMKLFFELFERFSLPLSRRESVRDLLMLSFGPLNSLKLLNS